MSESNESTKTKTARITTFSLCASYGFILAFLISLGLLSQIKWIVPLFVILSSIGILGTIYSFVKQKSSGILFDSVFKGLSVGAGLFTIVSALFLLLH